MDIIDDKKENMKDFIKELYNIIRYTDNNNDLHLIKLTRGIIFIKCKELEVFTNDNEFN
jgi:hypothetical protein